MRILLDENIPIDFAKLLVGHDISTVHGLGWSGIKNGELLRRANEICEIFVTLDRNLEFQQNISVLPFGIVVVRAKSNRIADLISHIQSILKAVEPGARIYNIVQAVVSTFRKRQEGVFARLRELFSPSPAMGG